MNSFGAYTFLPWLRRGISNQLQTAATATSRASLSVGVRVRSEKNGADVPVKIVSIVGPGDIVGMHERMVLRTEPRAECMNFEPNYLAYVDFCDEDFVWRYTPQAPDKAQHRLLPWLTLLVLKEGEFRRPSRPRERLRKVELDAAANLAEILPPAGELWAWAHAHLNASLGASGTPNLDVLSSLLRQNPELGYSRLLSPRRLEPDTRYRAFVIPTFEVGRLAGLGQPVPKNVPGLAIAWAAARVFPSFYDWSFGTGSAGDFEDLVRLLKPRDIDPRVGVRELDVREPGFLLPTTTGQPNGVVGLEGVLLAPTTRHVPPAPGSNLPSGLAEIVNLPSDLLATGTGAEEDPVVSAPLYGRWHALVERTQSFLEHKNWVSELNTDARFRAVAGAATRVIQKNQEEYMKLAWRQIGDVLSLNRRVRGIQLAVKANRALYAKNVEPLPVERGLAFAAPVMAKVLGSPVTVHELVRRSRLPATALGGAMRKQVRERGRLVKRALGSKRVPLATLVRGLNSGSLSAAPERAPFTGTTLEGTLGSVAPDVSDLVALLARNRLLFRLFALLALAVLLFLAPFALVWPVLFAVALGAVFYDGYLGDVARALETVELLRIGELSPAAIEALPPNDAFVLPDPAPPLEVHTPSGGPDSPQAAAFRSAAVEFQNTIGDRPLALPPKAPLAVEHVHERLLTALEPARAFTTRFAPTLRVGRESLNEYVGRYHDAIGELPAPRVVPVMAYPDIPLPMYVPLKDQQKDDFVPNLDLIPPNTISLMLTNPPVIEAYMVGLNHEFARELLFREFPTDQRPSSFRQFWDPSNYVDRDGLKPEELAEKLKDVRKLHEWPLESNLGAHRNGAPGDETPRVVLVIRGELLKRYPNVLIYAQRARWGGPPHHQNHLLLYDEKGEQIVRDPKDPNLRFPMFRAQVESDLAFIGFDLKLDEVRGDPSLEETEEARKRLSPDDLGWFFVLQEVVGEPRFGLDEHAVATSEDDFKWNHLAWENLGPVKLIELAKPFASQPPGTDTEGAAWGAHAADMAFILFQRPALIAVHARDMLKNLSVSGS